MEKREYILREEALSHPFANGKYDRKNANIDFILGCESYKEWLETFHAFTEQDIVKHVLEKIRAEIEEERVHDDWDFGQEIYYNKAIEDVLQIIDRYKSESENA